MKTKKSLLYVVLLGISTMLFSFISPMGGEGFEIYLDNRVVLQKFHKDMIRPTNLLLGATHANSELQVKFYHCGMAGKSRSLSLKDANHKLLKQWEFTNEKGKSFAVSIPVKEVLNFQQKAGDATLYLYYSSKEAAGGRLLTGIVRSDRKARAAR